MSLKAELEAWAGALVAYDENDFDRALALFEVCSSHSCRFRVHSWSSSSPSQIRQRSFSTLVSSMLHSANTKWLSKGLSRLLVWISIWLSRECLFRPPSRPCSSVDRYFQCGVSNFLIGRYELALKDFDEALLYLRGNQTMFVLFSPSKVASVHLRAVKQKLRTARPQIHSLFCRGSLQQGSLRDLPGQSARRHDRYGGGSQGKGDRGTQCHR
jgi:hypothetical protein